MATTTCSLCRRRRRHVEVFRGRDKLWRFRLVGGNHEKQTASQAYHGKTERHSKYSAKRGAGKAHPGVPIEVVE
jgi:uncharacterized protein YegP (UPF0339 family)